MGIAEIPSPFFDGPSFSTPANSSHPKNARGPDFMEQGVQNVIM